jgi:hypothetical protein
MNPDELLERATNFYLTSEGFNGLPVHGLHLEVDELRTLIRPLVESGRLYVNYGDRHPNPHVLAFDPEPLEEQLRKLDGEELEAACLYPLPSHLQTVVNPADYEGRPYTLELALGYPVLGYHCFDLSILRRLDIEIKGLRITEGAFCPEMCYNGVSTLQSPAQLS